MKYVYTEKNTRAKDVPVRPLGRVGVGRMVVVEVLSDYRATHVEPIGRTHQVVVNDFRAGQTLIVSEDCVKEVRHD